MFRSFVLSLLCFACCAGGQIFLAATPAQEVKTLEADVIVYGDAAVGVSAAVQVARMGKKVILISQYGHLGGMTSSGLGWTDIGNSKILGGISREFYHRVFQHYNDPNAWVFQPRTALANKKGQGGILLFNPETELASCFEPKVAEAVFNQMAEDAGVQIVNGHLNWNAGAVLNENRIVAIRLQDGSLMKGKMFIDASYEGDLLPHAKVHFVVGREANAQYKEVSNAISEPIHKNNLPNGIDPFVIQGDPASGLLPGVNEYDRNDIGMADHRLQAYCYRMCLTNEPKNRIAIKKPDRYNESDYEILFRVIEKAGNQYFFKTSPMPNKKTDSNNNGGVSCDFIGMNYSPQTPDQEGYWDWTTLPPNERKKVEAQHRDWQLGLVWTLQNHPRVPEKIRQQYSQWGLPKDEFVDNGNWPYNLYIREGRRMVSDFVMTEHQCRQNQNYPAVTDSVGMGAYTMDSHNVQRVIFKGQLKNEGDIQRSLGGKPYPISYKSMVPKRGECENLLVPWCVSSSHIAFGSIRMEPVGMILGQSAGTAAVLAIANDCSVQAVDYEKLQKQLIKDGQVLTAAEK